MRSRVILLLNYIQKRLGLEIWNRVGNKKAVLGFGNMRGCVTYGSALKILKLFYLPTQ